MARRNAEMKCVVIEDRTMSACEDGRRESKGGSGVVVYFLINNPLFVTKTLMGHTRVHNRFAKV